MVCGLIKCLPNRLRLEVPLSPTDKPFSKNDAFHNGAVYSLYITVPIKYIEGLEGLGAVLFLPASLETLDDSLLGERSCGREN